jgi:hypothetical protein
VSLASPSDKTRHARHTPAGAFAAPEIIIVHGDPLLEGRVIADWQENHRLLLSVRPAAAARAPTLDQRPVLKLALFWGIGWRAYAESPERLRALRVEQANQLGHFYPATRRAPAYLIVGRTAGVVSDSGLAVLRRHRVPIRVP